MEKTEFEIAASMLRGKLVDIARFYLSDEDEAEDIVQEAMLKLWLVRDRIDREKNISPMGMTVTRNLCIDRLRRLKTHPHESLTGHDAPDGQRSAQAMRKTTKMRNGCAGPFGTCRTNTGPCSACVRWNIWKWAR